MIKRNRVDNKKRRLRKKLYLGEFALKAQCWRFNYDEYPGVEVIDALHDRLCDLHDQGVFVMPLAFSSREYTAIHLERSIQTLEDTFYRQVIGIEKVMVEEFGIRLQSIEPESDEYDPWEVV